MRWLICILLFLVFYFPLSAQYFFKGEVIYRSELYNKVKGKVVKDTTQSPDFIKASFKDGNWLQQPDGGIVEYMYFDTASNKIYWKLRYSDVLFFEDGRYRRAAENDPAMKYHILPNTDTILGKNCNSLIIQTKALKLTIVYSTDLAVNPAWYKKTRVGFYDLVYSKTKAVFLKSVVETRQSVSVTTATEVYDTDVTDDVFPEVQKMRLKPLR